MMFKTEELATFCLLVATSRGSLILLRLGPMEDLENESATLNRSSCLFKATQKSETPVLLQILDDDGKPHRTGRLPAAIEHFVVYVVATGIKIILLSQANVSEVFKEKDLKNREGLILQSEVFYVKEAPYLACVTSVGTLRVYSLPDVKLQSSFDIPVDSFDANTLINSFLSSSGFLTLWSRPSELRTFRIARKEHQA